jgi:hypothetical protein
MGSDPERNEQYNETRRKSKERGSDLAVLYLFLFPASLASLVDDHTQRSPARELLA